MIAVELTGFGVVRLPGYTPYPIYVISVQQQIQSWMCYRRYSSFRSLYEHLLTSKGSSGIPQIPIISEETIMIGGDNFEKARIILQQWLLQLLQNPAIRESQMLQNFLCMNANSPPPGLELIWSSNHCPSFDDMEMDELFDRNLVDNRSDVGSDTDNEDSNLNSTNGNALFDVFSSDHVDMEFGSIGAMNNYSKKFNQDNAYDPSLDMPSEDEIASSVPVEITFISQGTGSNSYMNAAHTLLELSSNTRSTDYKKQYTGVISSSTTVMALGENTNFKEFDNHKPSSKPKVGLDNFKIIKVIGKGSFGKVFLVRDKLGGEIYAMKVLRKDNIIRRNQVEHTKTERNVLGYVRHPFIVGLNMAFQTRDKLFFVLDYCAGGELFFHLGKLGKFPEDRSKFYAAEIALALEHVHKLDIVYRDLKPENVLLDGEGHVRLTDFGLSKEGITNNTSGAHSFCGTPEYLAPEILNRQGHGRAVDWWSLGALLYEMLTGLPPFYCRDREKLFEKIRCGQLSYPRSLSEPAQSILHGLLTRDPAARLGSSTEDSSEVKRHIFFVSIDWDRMIRRELRPPWIPTVYGSVDTSQFDVEFTSMPIFSPSDREFSRCTVQSNNSSGRVSQSQSNSLSQSQNDHTFEGFTYVDKSSLLLANQNPARVPVHPRSMVDLLDGDDN